MKIGVLSDTHGTLPEQVYSFFAECDEIWHAGDVGENVLEALQKFKPTKAVYGNTDGYPLRYDTHEVLIFHREDQKVVLTHIGGWPGHYHFKIKQLLEAEKPDIFVCGHSHILKVMYDKEMNLLHINPGAAGRQGFHRVCTLVRFDLNPTPDNLEIMEFEK